MSATREVDWADLMRAANRGDQAAYRRLLEALTPYFRAIARRGLSRAGAGTADSEDLVQDMLLAVHLKRATWREDEPIGPWLGAIARYKLIDQLRRRGRRAEVAIEPFEAVLEAAPEDTPSRDRDVARALETLPAGQRAVVQAIAVDGADIATTAGNLGLSAGAVRVAFHRGLAALAAKFGKDAP